MKRLQHIEYLIRFAYQRLLVALLAPGAGQRMPDLRTLSPRVLFIRDDGIGDLIVSIEIMRAIAESAPGVRLDVLCSPGNAALARTLPFVNDVIVHRRGSLWKARPTWKALRQRGYDVVVDGRVAVGNVNTHTTMLMLGTRAPWRVGVGERGNDHAYNVKVRPASTEHWVDYLVSLGQPFGVTPGSRDWRPRLSFTENDRAVGERLWSSAGAGKPRVFVNISVGNTERLWRHDRYEPVMVRLRELLPEATVIVSFMPEDKAMADKLAGLAGGAALVLTFHEVVSAVATADLVITPDTAVTHVASVFQTPTLALMRKDTNPWAPYRTPGKIVFGDIKRRLEPGLPTSRVISGLEEIVAGLARVRPPVAESGGPSQAGA